MPERRGRSCPPGRRGREAPRRAARSRRAPRGRAAPSPCRPVLSCRPSDPDQPEARRRGEQQPGELRAPPRHHEQRDGEDAPEERQQEQGKADRKSVVLGKSVSVRVDLGGSRIIKKKKK